MRARDESEGGGGKARVVVLDKDPFFRDFQRTLLAGQGFEVVAPTDPADFSADFVLDQGARLLITEILLPGTNGLDLVRDLRTRRGGDLRIIIFSVLNAESRSEAAGADRFVQKPRLRDSFLSTVLETLREAREEAIR